MGSSKLSRLSGCPVLGHLGQGLCHHCVHPDGHIAWPLVSGTQRRVVRAVSGCWVAAAGLAAGVHDQTRTSALGAPWERLEVSLNLL